MVTIPCYKQLVFSRVIDHILISVEVGPMMKGRSKRPPHGHLMGTARMAVTILVRAMELFWLVSFIVRTIIEV